MVTASLQILKQNTRERGEDLKSIMIRAGDQTEHQRDYNFTPLPIARHIKKAIRASIIIEGITLILLLIIEVAIHQAKINMSICSSL